MDGKRHGRGTFTFTKKLKYVGEFKYDGFNGQGTLTMPDGQYVGEFKDNKYIGQGAFITADGDIEEII